LIPSKVFSHNHQILLVYNKKKQPKMEKLICKNQGKGLVCTQQVREPVTADKKDCTKTRVISKLPYNISEAGDYCLASSFTWSDPTRSAITVSNGQGLLDGVSIDFGTQSITVTVASNFPVISISNASNIRLSNVSILGVRGGQYTADGVEILSSSDVVIESPNFQNLRLGLYVESVTGLTVKKLFLSNDVALADRGNSILIYNSTQIDFWDAKVSSATVYFSSVENVDIRRLKSNNFNVSAVNCLVIASNAFTNKIVDNSIPSPLPTKNVYIGHSELLGVDWDRSDVELGACLLVKGSDICNETNNGVIIENNIITAQIRGIEVWNTNGGILRGNQVRTLQNSAGLGLSSCIEVSAQGWRIENNNIGAELPDIARLFQAGIIMSNPHCEPPVEVGSYNSIVNNTATGLTDAFRDIDGGQCNVYRDNISTGNDLNYNVNVTLNTFLPSNVSGCTGSPTTNNLPRMALKDTPFTQKEKDDLINRFLHKV
jgi:hypothetical protein